MDKYTYNNNSRLKGQEFEEWLGYGRNQKEKERRNDVTVSHIYEFLTCMESRVWIEWIQH